MNLYCYQKSNSNFLSSQPVGKFEDNSFWLFFNVTKEWKVRFVMMTSAVTSCMASRKALHLFA